LSLAGSRQEIQVASAEQMARLKAVVPAAQASGRKWGVPASVTLAQWIPESSWGSARQQLHDAE
jgi:flagellum-specific peptidoglycan hydrolase FlgJ